MRWRDGAALPLLGDDAARGRGPDALGATRSRWLWARRTRRRTRWSSRSVFCGREDGRLVALGQMVREGLRPPLLIFVQSIERAMQLFHALAYDGLGVGVLHAERTAARGRRRRRTRRAAVAQRPTTPRRPTGARRHGHGPHVATSAAQRWARRRKRPLRYLELSIERISDHEVLAPGRGKSLRSHTSHTESHEGRKPRPLGRGALSPRGRRAERLGRAPAHGGGCRVQGRGAATGAAECTGVSARRSDGLAWGGGSSGAPPPCSEASGRGLVNGVGFVEAWVDVGVASGAW